MSKLLYRLRDFVEGLSDEAFDKLFTPSAHPSNLYRDRNFHLDWQNTTSDKLHYNFQVQVNKETEEKALKKLKGCSVTMTLIPVDNS
ncbi:MAG: hypothetical protein M1826_005122 [Phylliscum demangeonii]|nr:MAG: hypothetical protein M1826_005122 [Phylliscum demangeonii]